MENEVKKSSSVKVIGGNGSSSTSSAISIINKYLHCVEEQRQTRNNNDSGPVDKPPMPPAGEQPKYKVGEPVAKGGMGTILNAKDLNINRTVAMKVLLETKQKREDNVIRFIEEAQITGQLEHPGIVPVYELGINDEGVVFYTMKFMKGVTLKQIIRELRNNNRETIAKFPLSSLLNILQKVCDAVAFAHSKGVIHRDLKPENIMVGDFGEVSVMDWGLAKITAVTQIQGLSTVRTELVAADFNINRESKKVLEPKPSLPDIASISASASFDSVILDEDGESIKTLDGQILGTPNYMAPEQAVGQSDQIGMLTDIYALGGILYNILTLTVPITGKSFTEMMVNIVRGHIEPPSGFSQSSRKSKKKDSSTSSRPRVDYFPHCPGGKIPDSLSAVAMKALALKPKDRYQDVKLFQQDISAYQQGFATKAEDAGFLKQVILLIKRNKAVFSILCASMVGLISVVTIFFVQLKEAYHDISQEKKKVDIQNIQLDKQSKQLAKKSREVEKTNLQLKTNRDELKATNVQLEKKSDQLEKKKDQLENKTIELQQTIDQLIQEKKRTERERRAKEREREAKEKEQQLRLIEQLAKEKEKQAREEVSKLSAPEFVKRAQELSESSNWDEAIETINTALKLDNSLEEGWYLKGRLDFGSLQFDKAISAFNKGDFPDRFGLRVMAEKYKHIMAQSHDQLSASELRKLSLALREKGDDILADRIYHLALEKEKEILARLNKIRPDLKKLNPGLTDINYQYSISGDIINVDLSNNKELKNIEPLSGLPVVNLNLSFTQVYDLNALRGMPLQILHVPNGLLSNISVLAEMPLKELHLHGKPKQDFTFIEFFKIARLHLHLYSFVDQEDYGFEFLKLVPMSRLHLYLHGALFNDLNILLSIPLSHLTLVDSVVTDINPLRYQKLIYLDISNTRVKNIRAVRNMPLKHLSLEKTLVRDISDLEGKSLEYLSLKNTGVRDIDVLKGMPLNYLDIAQSKVTDFSILRNLPLKALYLENLPLIDLQFLEQGMNLTSLSLKGTYISDIRPLKDMPLTHLDISGTKVTNIIDLERMLLVYLAINDTSITDIKVVKGMPLRHLDLSKSGVTDITPLEGMHLNFLSLRQTDISDISPLRGMPIKALSLADCKNIKFLEPLANSKHLQKLIIPGHLKNIQFLQSLPSLEYISNSGDLESLKQTADEFWINQ